MFGVASQALAEGSRDSRDGLGVWGSGGVGVEIAKLSGKNCSGDLQVEYFSERPGRADQRAGFEVVFFE